VEQSPVSVIITDTRGIIQYVNPKFTHLMGYTAAEAIGKTPRIIKGSHLTREFYKDMWETILAGKEWHGVFQNRTKAGNLVWEAASISPIRDDEGTITHFVGIKEDITEIKRLQDQLEHLARHDPLTGLPNRHLFTDRLRQALAQGKRRKAPFAILYLDLNDFKPVNDVHGHKAGDALLVEVGRRLTACVRESDTVARMGGDEFTVLLTDIHGPENAHRIAGTIVEALGRPFLLEEGTCTIGASLGMALFPEDGATADLLLSKADTAMYQAKQSRT
jgi:diguanylate cyclase (GGDEF)-like protein/PAS domain S-box-containing protein